MSSVDTSRFRMTLWPGVPLPLPPLPLRRSVYRLDSSEALLIGSGLSVPLGPDARVGECYLELYALDLAEPAALVEFANTYGRLSGHSVHRALGSPSSFSPQEDRRARDAIMDADPKLQGFEDRRQPGWTLEIETLESFRFAASTLRDLTNAWRLVSADPTFDAASHMWELPYAEHDSLGEKRFFALLLLGQLGMLLARFRPYVMATSDPEWDAEDADHHEEPAYVEVIPGVDVEAAASITFTDLAELCALELFNHIAGSEVYRQCQNENCVRTFVCQYGRAEVGQTRRQGVMYCSSHCSQAAASRNYRRRERAKRQSSGTRGGLESEQRRANGN